MAEKDTQPSSRGIGRSPGYRTCVVEAGDQPPRGREPAAGKPTRKRPPKGPGKKPPEERVRTPEHLVLFGGDRYGAIAHDRRIRFYRYDDLPADGGAVRPVAEIRTDLPVIGLANRPSERRLALVAALANRSLVEFELPEPVLGRDHDEKPRSHVLLDDVGGELRYLVCTRRSTLAVVDRASGAGLALVAVNAVAGGTARRADLPLANLTSVSALDPQRSDLLVAVDARHGAHVLGFPTGQDSATIEVAQVDPEVRATAMAALSDQWLVVARKGGELIQVRATPAIGGRAPIAAEVCQQLRRLLRACGCECRELHPPGHQPPCDCGKKPTPPVTGEPGHPGTPGNGGPPGGAGQDDEPCQERQRATLGWTVAQFRRAGRYLIALAAGGERMAVLDRNLNVVFERYLGPRGSLVAASPGGADRMLVMQRGKNTLEAWSLDEYVPALRGTLAPAPGHRPADPTLARPVTFRGRKSRPASPNPHLRVCVFTVTEPGQAFGDPDQAKMQALLETNVYDIAYDYYRENSFQTLETEFTVFGVHLGAPRAPLVLPRSFASYFYDDYTPGGIEAVMPADWTDPPVFDGTEAMTLHSEPALGVGKDYAIPFAALWTTHTHNFYPVAVNFAGTETLQINVEDETGTARVLNARLWGADAQPRAGRRRGRLPQRARPACHERHPGGRDRGRSPDRDTGCRVPAHPHLNDDDTQFGRLQGQFRVAAAGSATQKGHATLTLPGMAPAALVAIGAGWRGLPLRRVGQLIRRLTSYFAECLHAAQLRRRRGRRPQRPPSRHGRRDRRRHGRAGGARSHQPRTG